MDGAPLRGINELEIIRESPTGLAEGVDVSDYVFANKFQTNSVYLIHIPTARVV